MKAVFAVDTSCIIAVVATWDRRHSAAAAEVERRLARGERMSISIQALTEAYSVLTRIPLPFRMQCNQAAELLDRMFVQQGSVTALDAESHIEFVLASAKQEIAGGRIYDAVIGECARVAAAKVLLTYNTRHFDPPPAGVTVIAPGPG